MTDREFAAEIKKGLSGGYFLYGDEEFLKKYYLDAAVKSVVGMDELSMMNLCRLDGDNYSPAALEDALSAFPMMADRICVVLSMKFQGLSEKALKAFCDILEGVGERPCVFLAVAPKGGFDEGNLKKGRPTAAYKLISEKLTMVNFSKGTPGAVKKWVMRHFEAEGLVAEGEALDLLCEYCGYDLTLLSMEMSKLSAFCKANEISTVGRDTVREVSSDYSESGTFDLTNAVLNGDRRGALKVLRDYKDKRKPAASVMAALTSDFSNMLEVALLMQEGMSKQEIARMLSIHEFRVSKYMDAVRGTPVAKLRAALERCRDADGEIKSSRLDYISIERFICTMPAKKRLGGYRG